jgi:hypothetical protein
MIPHLLLLHLVCMLGALGGLLLMQFGIPATVRRDEAVARGAARFLSILIGLGLLAGAALYGMKKGHLMGPHYNGIIAVKFVLLLAAGGLLAMSKRPGKGDMFRWIAAGLLAAAIVFGASLSP